MGVLRAWLLSEKQCEETFAHLPLKKCISVLSGALALFQWTSVRMPCLFLLSVSACLLRFWHLLRAKNGLGPEGEAWETAVFIYTNS